MQFVKSRVMLVHLGKKKRNTCTLYITRLLSAGRFSFFFNDEPQRASATTAQCGILRAN